MHQMLKRSAEMTIGGYKIGTGNPVFLIAEIGINHNGSVEIAKKLIDLAAKNGFEAVKFQKRTVPVVYSVEELAKSRSFDCSFIDHATERSKKYGYDVLPREAQERLANDLEATTNGDLKYALEFNEPEYVEIDAHCKEKGILWTVSPWDVESVEFMRRFDPPFFKIASASLTDATLLRAVARMGKPVVLSTGASTMEQIAKAVELLESVPVALLYCVSTYPAKDEDLNLRCVCTLQKEFPSLVVGYSGHENGTTMSVVAAALGASIIERHITLDRAMPGSDQSASLEPLRLEAMVINVRRLERTLGDGVKRVIDAEVPVMQKLRRVSDF